VEGERETFKKFFVVVSLHRQLVRSDKVVIVSIFERCGSLTSIFL